MKIELNLNGGLGARFLAGPREVNNHIHQYIDAYTGVLYVASDVGSPTPVINPDGTPVVAKSWFLQLFDGMETSKILRQEITPERVEWEEQGQKYSQTISDKVELKAWEDKHYLLFDKESTRLFGTMEYKGMKISADIPYNPNRKPQLTAPINADIYDLRFFVQKIGCNVLYGGVIL